jgi:polyisoprenoid-binding protein YceI
MKKSLLIIFGILFLLSFTFLIKQWKYIPKDAKVKFTLFEKKGTEEGVFTGIDGFVKFDEKDVKNSSITAIIKVATINSGVEMRDESLRSKDFFEVEKFPNIKFQSTTITKTVNGFVAKGKLTAKKVTKEISLPFTYATTSDTTALFKGSFEINRLDYGIGNKNDGVGTKVKIDLEIPVGK